MSANDPLQEILNLYDIKPSINELDEAIVFHHKEIFSTHLASIEYVDRYHSLLHKTDGAGESKSKSIALYADVQTNAIGCKVNGARRKWDDGSPQFNVKLTVIREFPEIPSPFLCTALATITAEYLNQILREHQPTSKVEVKWQNDLVINGLKVGGVLAEKIDHDSHSLYILSVGINIKNGSNLPTATNLCEYVELDDAQLAGLRKNILDTLIRVYSGPWPKTEKIQAMLSNLLAFKNQYVRFYPHRGDLTIYEDHYLQDVCLKEGKILTSGGPLYCETLTPLDSK